MSKDTEEEVDTGEQWEGFSVDTTITMHCMFRTLFDEV